MKIKLPLLLIFIIIASTQLHGQSAIGLQLFPPQFSKFTRTIGAFQNDPAYSKYSPSMFVGVQLGLDCRIQLKERHYLKTGLLYSMRGERRTYTTSQLSGYSILSLSGGNSSLEYFLDYRVHYLEVPIMYSIDLSYDTDSPVHIFLSTGFSTGFNVSSKIAQNSFTITSPGSMYSGYDEHDTVKSGPPANPVILNYVADIDLEFRRQKRTKYFIYGRYNTSLTNVYKSGSLQTKVVTFGLGFGLRWYIRSDV